MVDNLSSCNIADAKSLCFVESNFYCKNILEINKLGFE